MTVTGLFTQEVVAGSIEPRRRTTFYTRYGDVFARATLGAALLGVIGVGLVRRVWRRSSVRFRACHEVFRDGDEVRFRVPRRASGPSRPGVGGRKE